MQRSDKKRWVVIGNRDVCFFPYAVFKTRSAAEKYIEEECQKFFSKTLVELRLDLVTVDYFKE